MPRLTEDQRAELRQRYYNATLTGLRLANPELGMFRVRPDRPLPPIAPGQYLTLGLGLWEDRVAGVPDDVPEGADAARVLRRAYSISHPILDDAGELVRPEKPHDLEFYIVLVRESGSGGPSGLTPRLFSLKVGDRLQIGEKVAGHYTLAPVQPSDTVVFLATGTGEAPHNFMIWHLLSSGHRGPIVSVSCVRLRADLGYLETHRRLEKMFPHYHYVPMTTREPEDLGRKVYIQGLLENRDLERRTGVSLDPSTTHVFLCGNPKMIGVPTYDKATGTKSFPKPVGCVELLEGMGFRADLHGQKQPGNVHFEEYW